MHVRRSTCRACDSPDLQDILSLGELPLADNLLSTAQLAAGQEPRYPLTAAFCRSCTLVQLLETVSPSALYDESYRHYASSSDSVLRHAREHAEALIEARGLGRDSHVVEIGSNDGYLLRNFRDRGVPVLGIDPAPGPAQAARRAGIPTLPVFFTREIGRQLRDEGRQADVIVANNVLAQVPDLHGFTAGLRMLLKDTGVITIEVPYVRDLVEDCEFDTIYHERLCYFSVTSLDRLLRSEGLYANDVEHFPSIQGGTLRLWVGTAPHATEAVQAYLEEETHSGLTSHDFYTGLARRARFIKDNLLALLNDLKASGARIAGYGAAAKGATLLNYTGLDRRYLDYVVDRNVYKQGRYTPGVHLPVVAPQRLLEDMPDYILLLAWNLRDEILVQQEAYTARGGEFILPIPLPTVLSRA